MPTIKAITSSTSPREGIFPEERFVYHNETDTYTCAAGHVLKKRSAREDKQNIEYAASKNDLKIRQQLMERSRARSTRFLVIGEIADKQWSGVVTYRGEKARIISVRRSRKEEVDPSR